MTIIKFEFMSAAKFNFKGAVYLLLKKKAKILLLRRFNTGWRDGYYTLVAGHIDGNEGFAQCMARETKEESGIVVKPRDLKVIHVVHHFNDPSGNGEYIDFYLTTTKWSGDPKITEPEKCDDMQWFPINKLPKNILPNVKVALKKIKKGQIFSEFDGSNSQIVSKK